MSSTPFLAALGLPVPARLAGGGGRTVEHAVLARDRLAGRGLLDRGGEQSRVLARLGDRGGHVGGDVLRVAPLDQAGGHQAARARVRDLLGDGPTDAVALE